jgi:hypothetical protein
MKECIKETTFRTHEANDNFLVMNFSFTNYACSTFESSMISILKPFFRKLC